MCSQVPAMCLAASHRPQIEAFTKGQPVRLSGLAKLTLSAASPALEKSLGDVFVSFQPCDSGKSFGDGSAAAGAMSVAGRGLGDTGEMSHLFTHAGLALASHQQAQLRWIQDAATVCQERRVMVWEQDSDLGQR